MATGLKRDPTLILRIDGEDLREFLSGPTFEVEMRSIFQLISSSTATTTTTANLHDSMLSALHKLGVEHGLPPPSDPWVLSNILEPALQGFPGKGTDEEAVTEEVFLMEVKRVAAKVADHLKEQPVIVAHTETIFDGSGIRRLLGNKFELDKALNTALEALPRDGQGKISKQHLHTALVSAAAWPPFGSVQELDKAAYNVIKNKCNDDGPSVKEEEFKKLLEDILGSMAVELDANPISITSSSVAHDTIVSYSAAHHF